MDLRPCLLAALLASVALSPTAASPGLSPGMVLPPPRPASPEAPLDPAGLPEAPVPPVARNDPESLSLIFKAYREGDWTEALILKSSLTDPAATALAEWFAIRAAIPIGWQRLSAFRRDYPDWPVTTLYRRRLEEAIFAERRPAEEVRAFFADREPATASGRLALALALKADGLDTQANALARQVWREDAIGESLENRILDQFPNALKTADHRFRMERFLLKENWSAATRAATLAGKDYLTLVKARMGLYRGKKITEKSMAEVPGALRRDASYVFSRALQLRRNKDYREAAKVLADAPRDAESLVDGDEWWAERRLVARELLDLNDPKAAYAVTNSHGAESPAKRIEAEFHSGWIALRFLGDPAAASRHFAAIADTGTTPISTSRVAYWQGRAAEAEGRSEDAARFFALAAEKSTTFYGQLATEKLARPITLRQVAPLAEAAREAFEARIPVQALKLLTRTDEPELLLGLYNDLAQNLADGGELDALASVAAASDNARAVLLVGKVASQRGFPLDLHAYPVSAIPDFDPVGDEVEPAMVYAIARQESAFNPRAVSSAGARGLMQLMPTTARRTAERFGVGFDLNRLVDDPAYNAKLGAAHLGELMEDWRGSHILAFASYNAGGGNVKKWVNAHGDPRQPGTDLVDWIERIPFYETRNYVQRVMENLAVYRQRLAHPVVSVAKPETVAAPDATAAAADE